VWSGRESQTKQLFGGKSLSPPTRVNIKEVTNKKDGKEWGKGRGKKTKNFLFNGSFYLSRGEQGGGGKRQIRQLKKEKGKKKGKKRERLAGHGGSITQGGKNGKGNRPQKDRKRIKGV